VQLGRFPVTAAVPEVVEGNRPEAALLEAAHQREKLARGAAPTVHENHRRPAAGLVGPDITVASLDVELADALGFARLGILTGVDEQQVLYLVAYPARNQRVEQIVFLPGQAGE